jgi:hypothetical protein
VCVSRPNGHSRAAFASWCKTYDSGLKGLAATQQIVASAARLAETAGDLRGLVRRFVLAPAGGDA